MPSRPLPNLALRAFYALGEDGWKDEQDLNLLKVSVLAQGGFADKVAATPGVPAAGDVYVFSETHPTNPNAVAVFDDAVWKYFTPQEGWLLYNRTQNYYEKFDGAVWAQLQTGGVPEAPVDTKIYGRKDAAWAEIVASGSGGGDVVLLEEREITVAAANTDFTGLISSTYRDYIVEISNLVLSDLNAILFMQYSQDNGATFDASAIYTSAAAQWNQGTFGSNLNDGPGQTRFNVSGSVGGLASDACSITLTLHNPSHAAGHKGIKGQIGTMSGDGNLYVRVMAGRYASNLAVNAFRLFPSAGTITSGIVRIYGKRKIAAASGQLQLIERIVLAVDAATVDFLAIPSTFEDLHLSWMGATTQATNLSELYARFNNDATLIYDQQKVHWYSSGGSAIQATSQDKGMLGDIAGGNAVGAGRSGSGNMQIASYARTTFWKSAVCNFHNSFNADVDFTQGVGIRGFQWRNTVAIDRITLFPAAGTFKAGSVFSLYGRK